MSVCALSANKEDNSCTSGSLGDRHSSSDNNKVLNKTTDTALNNSSALTVQPTALSYFISTALSYFISTVLYLGCSRTLQSESTQGVTGKVYVVGTRECFGQSLDQGIKRRGLVYNTNHKIILFVGMCQKLLLV